MRTRRLSRLTGLCTWVMLAVVSVLAHAVSDTDIPPVGRSTFDAVFTSPDEHGNLVYDVPYPFDRVIDRLNVLSGNPTGKDTHRLQMVMIPLGRCVQRHSASPHEFKSPRFVIATDSELDEPGLANPVFIKDRLFLGYQRAAGVIEAISYNEMASRFEFQVVENYTADATPTVSYVRRERCISCHQNEGPIFSRVRWGETTANRRVYLRLMSEIPRDLRELFGPRTDQAYFLDASTDRANMLPIYQTLWHSLCDSTDVLAAVRCRAGALEFALQHRLRSAKGTYTPSEFITGYFVPMSRQNFEARWREGLEVPNPDVPTRYPLHEPQSDRDVALDLEQPRRRKMLFTLKDFPSFIDGLAASIPALQMRELDRRLLELGVADSTLHRSVEGQCDIARQAAGKEDFDVVLSCALADTLGGKNYKLDGDLYISGDRLIAAGNQFLLGSDNTVIALRSGDSRVQQTENHWRLDLDVRAARDGIHAWLATEGALNRIQLEWEITDDWTDELAPELTVTGHIKLQFVFGYEPLSAALENLVDEQLRGQHDLLSGPAFRGTEMMAKLLHHLRAAVNPWCCSQWDDFPPIVLNREYPTPSHASSLPIGATTSNDQPVFMTGVRERYD